MLAYCNTKMSTVITVVDNIQITCYKYVKCFPGGKYGGLF